MNKKIGMGTAAGVLIIVAAFIVMFAASYKKTRNQNENVGNSAPVTVNTPSGSNSKPSSATDETADWKTYKSDDFGFEIKYPDDWKLAPCEGNCQGFGPQDQDAIVEARVIDRPIEKAKLWLPTLGMGNGITGEENVTINGLPALRLTITQDAPPSNKKFIEMLIGKNGKTYDVGIATDSQSLMAIYNKMLSTFKFTDQTSSLDTSDWETYESKSYNYELKYPPYWQLTTYTSDGDILKYNGAVIYLEGIGFRIPYDLLGESEESYKSKLYKEKKDFIDVNGSKYDVTNFMLNDSVKAMSIDFPSKDRKDKRNRTSQITLFGKVDESKIADFNNIISSLRFTDQTSSADTSNWKTYRSDKYKFEMKYPISWRAVVNKTKPEDEDTTFLLGNSWVFQVQALQGDKDLDELMKRYENDNEVEKVERTTFMGLGAIRVLYKGGKGEGVPPNESLVFQEGAAGTSYTYNFHFYPASFDSARNSEANAVISTFKFL